MRLPSEGLIPADINRASALVADLLQPFVDRDWSRLGAGDLEWNVRETVCHMVDVSGSYALLVGSRSARRLRVDVRCHAEATNADLLHALGAVSAAFADAVAHAPASARAWHYWGLADVDGFMAIVGNELLIHGSDAAAGLDALFEPPADLCEKIVRRLFPWAPHGNPPWQTLLWSSGRRALGSHARLPPDWMGHPAPLQEWDGRKPW